MPHAKFHFGFIQAALFFALIFGFGLGAHNASIIGLQMPLHAGFMGYLQLHGHIQLFGWAGLFIIGISLHFLPRMTSASLPGKIWQNTILALIASGLALRSICHSLLPYTQNSIFYTQFEWLIFFSALLEWVGILIYILLIAGTLRRASAKAGKIIPEIAPFLVLQLIGWGLVASLNLILVYDMARAGDTLVHPLWHNILIQIFTGFILLPVAFAFSIRMLPLYLRLAPINWPVQKIAFGYVGFMLLTLLTKSSISPTINFLYFLATVGKNIFILSFIWHLDILTRHKKPWSDQFVTEKQKQSRRKTARVHMPDYGEFGRFERLVYSAYFWLATAAITEVAITTMEWQGFALPRGDDLVRHLILFGFITLLIFGMAPRMLPGFLGKKRVACTGFVNATFWLGNIAVLCRVLPLAIPLFPGGDGQIATYVGGWLYAISGLIAIAALLLLAINLTKTRKQ